MSDNLHDVSKNWTISAGAWTKALLKTIAVKPAAVLKGVNAGLKVVIDDWKDRKNWE